jgi:uncharacterized membrane protein
MSDTINQQFLRLRQLVLGLFYSLFAVLFLNSLGLTVELSFATLVIWLLQVAPLTLFVSGLHQTRIRTCQWFSFVVLMYFVHGVLTAFTPEKLLLGLLEVTICSLLFTCLILLIRKSRQVTSP